MPCASTGPVKALGTASRRTIAASIAAVASGVVCMHTARADDVRVERASGAEACPDAASFGTRIGEGVVTPGVDARARNVTVRFERTAKGFRSSIVTSDGMQRSLVDDTSSCEGLAEATLLAVRLTLDVPPSASQPAPVTAPVTVAAPAPPSPPDEAPRAPAPARRAWLGAEIIAGATLAVGIGSPVAPGFRGGAATTLDTGRWSIGITGVLLPSQTRDVGSGTVDVSVAGGGLEACGRARVGRPFLLSLCSRAEVLRLSGSARGFARAEEHARPMFTGTLLGRGQARVAGPVAAFIELGAVIPVVRERFAIDGVGVVYEPPFVAGSGGLGALVDFE